MAGKIPNPPHFVASRVHNKIPSISNHRESLREPEKGAGGKEFGGSVAGYWMGFETDRRTSEEGSMRWRAQEESENVEDRRGMPVSRKIVGGGLGTVVW